MLNICPYPLISGWWGVVWRIWQSQEEVPCQGTPNWNGTDTPWIWTCRVGGWRARYCSYFLRNFHCLFYLWRFFSRIVAIDDLLFYFEIVTKCKWDCHATVHLESRVQCRYRHLVDTCQMTWFCAVSIQSWVIPVIFSMTWSCAVSIQWWIWMRSLWYLGVSPSGWFGLTIELDDVSHFKRFTAICGLADNMGNLCQK